MSDTNVSDIKKAVMRQFTLGRLEEIGVFLADGHFDYGNGWHGSSYLNPHALLHEPYRVWQLAQELLDQIPRDILEEVEVTAGPATGGAHLAFTMATFIDNIHNVKKPRVLFAPLRPMQSKGAFEIPRHYRKLLGGKKVLLVDDVLNTGKTQQTCAALLGEVGAVVIATAQLFDRLSLKYHIPTPNYTLTEYDFSRDLVSADTCAQCRLKVKFTEF